MDMFGATHRMVTEVCGGTSCVMTKVYDASNHMMVEEPVIWWRYVELLKVFWLIVSVNLIIPVV